MKNLRKVLTLGLLLLTMFAMSLTAEAAAKVNKTLYVGQEFTVKSYKKAPKISKKKVLEVSKKGKTYTITAIKAGSSKVTTYNKQGKKSYVYKITVKKERKTPNGNWYYVTSYKKPKSSDKSVAKIEKVKGKKNTWKVTVKGPGTATITTYSKKGKKIKSTVTGSTKTTVIGNSSTPADTTGRVPTDTGEVVTQLQNVPSDDRRHVNTSTEDVIEVGSIKVKYVAEVPIKSNHAFKETDWEVTQYDKSGVEIEKDKMKGYRVEAGINRTTKKATIHAYLLADYNIKDVQFYDVEIVPNVTPYRQTGIQATCKKDGYTRDEKPAAADFDVKYIMANPANSSDNHTEPATRYDLKATHKAGYWYCEISSPNSEDPSKPFTTVVKVKMLNEGAKKVKSIRVEALNTPVDYGHDFSNVYGKDFVVTYELENGEEEPCSEFTLKVNKVDSKGNVVEGDQLAHHYDVKITDDNYGLVTYTEVPFKGEMNEEQEVGITAVFNGETVPKGHEFKPEEFTVTYTTNYENTKPCTAYSIEWTENADPNNYTVTVTDSEKGFTTTVNVPYQLAQTDDVDPVQQDPEYTEPTRTQTGLELICNRSEYQMGEQPSTADVTINAVFDDGSKEPAQNARFQANSDGTKWTLKAESNGFTSNVVEVPIINNIIDVALVNSGATVAYGDNNAVISAITVNDVYADGSTKPCGNYKFEVYEWNKDQKVAKVRVTCSTLGKSVETTVPYNAEVASLELQKYATSYTGEYTFNKDDFEVVLLYNDGTVEVVNDYSHNEQVNADNGAVTVTFEKSGFSKTITISKTADAPESGRED